MQGKRFNKAILKLIVILGVVIALLGTLVGLILSDYPLSLYLRRFESPRSALSVYEKIEIDNVSTSLDYSLPFTFVDALYLGNKSIIIYKYKQGGETDLAFLFLKKSGNKWRFINGFCELRIKISTDQYWQPGAYNFANLNIDGHKYAVCFSWLPLNSKRDIYVDGVKSDKYKLTIPTTDGPVNIYLCYALSNKPDSFWNNTKTYPSERHRYDIR